MTPKVTNCYHIAVEHEDSTVCSCSCTDGSIALIDSTSGPFGEMEVSPDEITVVSEWSWPLYTYVPLHL